MLRQSSPLFLHQRTTMKLLVRNLARTTTEHDIRKLFSEHGSVTECTLVIDQETGLSKGFAFVEMPDVSEAKTAIAALNMSNVAKSKIRVKAAQ
ncbi:RNA-binding protein [Vibrio albensis VL426]|nr:RNA-binding protein [Vibrio cholerae VL426]